MAILRPGPGFDNFVKTPVAGALYGENSHKIGKALTKTPIADNMGIMSAILRGAIESIGWKYDGDQRGLDGEVAYHQFTDRRPGSPSMGATIGVLPGMTIGEAIAHLETASAKFVA